jgi:DNA-binding GntR family transcriptional regulator
MDEAQYRAYQEEDKRFHTKIIEYSENGMIQEMNRSFAYLLRSYQKGLVRPPEETLDEHRKIVDAIKRRDGFQAQEMIIQHHLSSRQSIAEHCTELQSGSEEEAEAQLPE